ncbi:PIG-P-domain-containing protein, partial [Gongronella butleri]
VERAPPVAITNKTPIYEYYGFVMYLATFVVFGLYIIWAYLPDRILHDLGITYYPSRYWALAIPTWLMVLVWFIFFYYVTYNMMNTPPFDTLEAITDEHAVIMAKDSIPPVAARPPDYMPELHDIPIAVVNTFLYQDPSVIPLSTRSSGHQRTASSSSSHQRTSSTSSLSGHQRTSSQSGHQRTSSSSSFTSTQGNRRR